MGKKFTCRSEAQKRAIRLSYAKRAERAREAVDKNLSKRYPNGRTLKTKDVFLPTGKKGKSSDPKAQRRVVIVDSNRYDELAVVRLTTQDQPNTSLLEGYKQGNNKLSYFKHFVEIIDNEGDAIKVDGEKFIENPWAYDLTPQQINIIRDKIFGHTPQAADNRKKIVDLKSRGEKKDKKKRQD